MKRGMIATALLTPVAVFVALTANPFVGPFSGANGGRSAPPPTAAQIVAIVQDAGTLARANEDLYAASFNATGFSADGGTGGYVWGCGGPDCKYKLAEGSSMEMRATGNSVTFDVGEMHLPTTYVAAVANPSGSNLYYFSDPGKWQYDFPTTDTTGCAAGTEGGHKALSTGHRWVYCDGTTVQQLAYRASWSGAIDFAATPAEECDDGTFVATGAVLNEAVACGGCGSISNTDPNLSCGCSVTATDTVDVRVCCHGVVDCADPASITFSAAAVR